MKAARLRANTQFCDETNNDEWADYIESLVRGNGQFRRTLDSTELDEMMFDLCISFKNVELVL
jgi:hypothetical protein